MEDLFLFALLLPAIAAGYAVMKRIDDGTNASLRNGREAARREETSPRARRKTPLLRRPGGKRG